MVSSKRMKPKAIVLTRVLIVTADEPDWLQMGFRVDWPLGDPPNWCAFSTRSIGGEPDDRARAEHQMRDWGGRTIDGEEWQHPAPADVVAAAGTMLQTTDPDKIWARFMEYDREVY